MSVELDIKLGANIIAQDDLDRSLRERLANFSHNEQPLTWTLDYPGSGQIGPKEDNFSVSIGATAKVQCFCYSAGLENERDEEGGWWLSISVGIRNTESFFLLLMVASCIASLVGSPGTELEFAL